MVQIFNLFKKHNPLKKEAELAKHPVSEEKPIGVYSDDIDELTSKLRNICEDKVSQYNDAIISNLRSIPLFFKTLLNMAIDDNNFTVDSKHHEIRFHVNTKTKKLDSHLRRLEARTKQVIDTFKYANVPKKSILKDAINKAANEIKTIISDATGAKVVDMELNYEDWEHYQDDAGWHFRATLDKDDKFWNTLVKDTYSDDE